MFWKPMFFWTPLLCINKYSHHDIHSACVRKKANFFFFLFQEKLFYSLPLHFSSLPIQLIRKDSKLIGLFHSLCWKSFGVWESYMSGLYRKAVLQAPVPKKFTTLLNIYSPFMKNSNIMNSILNKCYTHFLEYRISWEH